MAAPSFRSSSFSYGWKYDVFLSFRGVDTRHGFTGNLYKALCDKGIHTFIDDEELQGGDEITWSLVEAIQESRLAIVVLSKDYASSSFCLDELAKIIDCIKEKGRLVLPVFYDVDPSDIRIRHDRGCYRQALANHENKFKANKDKFNDNMKRLEKWKMALNRAANLAGYHFKGVGYEYQFIGRIVEEVSSKINRAPLHVAQYPVGLESRVSQVISLLDVGSDGGVHMVGIYGIGGIGKTTLARAVYNSIADSFEGICFLGNVRENSMKHGLIHLQEMLLTKIVGEKDIKLGDVFEGISIIKHRFHRKKVLLILDDVDKSEQLEAMVGAPAWFGPGSRVIITTRDKQLLASHRFERVERTYEVERLNSKVAIELLNWKAFKTDKVDRSYLHILNRAVTYASCLPLALEVIGSNLSGKSIGAWGSTLGRYERIPNQEIQKILKVSFDALDEDYQSVFLDIACFYKGYELSEVEDILRAHHGGCMKHHIGVLVDKSLINIQDGTVTLHDLIEDMAKEIVRQESPEEPGGRSRLWLPKDIVQVLEDNKGTSKIQIINLAFPKPEEVVEWDGEAFKKMENLRTLVIRNGHFSEGPKHLPNNLRLLEWWGYPSESLPFDFHLKKLAMLEMPDGCLTSLGFPRTQKEFVNMTVLDLSGNKEITEIPDVSSVPNLKELSFKDCENLIEIDKSVGSLKKLRILDADGCSKLRSFPPIKLTSLKECLYTFRPKLIINGREFEGCFSLDERDVVPDHICICDNKQFNSQNWLDKRLLENEWNHAVISVGRVPSVEQIGIHVFNCKSRMEDIRFTDPLLLKEKHRVDTGVSQIQLMQHQQSLASSEPYVRQGKECLSLLPPPTLNDNLNWDSISTRISSTTSVQGKRSCGISFSMLSLSLILHFYLLYILLYVNGRSKKNGVQ